MSSEELKLMPMPSLGEFIDWVWQLKEDRDAARAQLAAIQGGMGGGGGGGETVSNYRAPLVEPPPSFIRIGYGPLYIESDERSERYGWVFHQRNDGFYWYRKATVGEMSALMSRESKP